MLKRIMAFLISVLITVFQSNLYAEPHSHGGRSHNHPLPKQGIQHRHGNGAYGVSGHGMNTNKLHQRMTNLKPHNTVKITNKGRVLQIDKVYTLRDQNNCLHYRYDFESVKNVGKKPIIKSLQWFGKCVDGYAKGGGAFTAWYTDEFYYSKDKFRRFRKWQHDATVDARKSLFNIAKVRYDEKASIQKAVSSRGNHWWMRDTYTDNTKLRNKKCLFAVPIDLLKKSSVFRFPIQKEDIKNVYTRITMFDRHDCVDGYIQANDLSIVISFTPAYIQRTGVRFKSLRVEGKMNKGIYSGEIGMQFNGLENTNDFKYLLTNNYYKKHKNQRYAGLKGIFGDGKNNFFYGRDNYVRNSLETTNKVKNYIDIDVKLSSGKNKNIRINDTLLTSKIESTKKNVYVVYKTRPKDVTSLIGKAYMVKLVLDFKVSYRITSNVKVFGISPVTFESEHFYKEIDLVLTKKNNWSVSGKELLREVESAYAGKVIGFRVNRRFSGIEEPKVYIKSIKAL